MFLIELAAQGVKGCSPTTRAPLKPGYVVLTPPGPQPVPVASLATAVLYSDGRGEEVAFAEAPGAKVALTLQGNDLVAYRLMRELGGAGTLQRLNKATSRFELVTGDTLEMGQFLRGQVGAPQKSAFEYLFTLTAAQLPSRTPKKAAQQGKGPARPALATAQPVQAASDVAAAQAKLKELERELELASGIDKLQFKQDELASQMFELESKLQSTEGLKLALQQAQGDHAAAPTLESTHLPADILSRCERYPTLLQKRDEALQKLAADREAEAQFAGVQVEPLWKDARFVGAALGGLALLGAALFLGDGATRYLALLDIPAFGFAALVALKWVDDVQGAQRSGRKDGMLAAREKKLVEDFEAEARVVKNAMHVLGVEDAQGVVDALGRKALLAERVEAIRAELAHAEANPEFASARQRYDQLKAKSDAITAQLQQASGGYVRDPREIERELGRVRESIVLAQAGGAVTTPAAGGEPEAAAGQQFEDPTPVLFSLAGDLFGQDPSALGALLKDRCAQYVAALTERRYVGVEWDHKGNATLLASDRKVPAGEAAPQDLDLYFVALRLTLVEKFSPQGKIPFLIEDVLGLAGEARQPLLARMLKHLGTLTQVIHVTAHPAFAPMADATASL